MKQQVQKKEHHNDPYGILMQEVVSELQKAIHARFGQDISISQEQLEIPPIAEMGDCALPCFFLAKQLKKSPIEIAQELESTCAESECIQRVRALGPYVNIFFHPAYIARVLFASKKYSRQKKQKKETIVIEYVSPNTNKPLHLGHMRNAVLGDSLSNIFECAGYSVIRTSLVNDRGIHICKSMVAYEKKQRESCVPRAQWDTPQSTGIKGDHFVGNYYVLYNQEAEKDDNIVKNAQECLLQWEKNDRATRALWKKMNTWALDGLHETYARLGIYFDKVYFESSLYTKGKDIVYKGLQQRLFKKDESGAVYADLSAYQIPNKILLRRDGTSLYITQDMFLGVQKAKDFHASRFAYVIGSEQDLYMKQLFAIFDILGYPWAKNLHHISYGMVCLPEGKMKSREGTKVDADVLLDTLEEFALKEVQSRGEKISRAESMRRAARIACGAVKFYLAEVGAKSDMMFLPEESISFTGRTGPYIQYAYARVKSILRKYAKGTKKTSARISYAWKQEKQLLLMVMRFSHTVQSAARLYDPSVVAKYIYGLAKTVNEYYHAVTVLRSAGHEQAARIALLKRVAETLKRGLALLGIETLEKM
jgi:arginyl-tRNA synthetase